jgi:DNA-binding NtrC family response regulator
MLFVDDEPSIRLTLPPILEAQGFQVRVADGIASALQEVSSQKFDVLLSDLNISEAGDGFVVVKAARAAKPLLRCHSPDWISRLRERSRRNQLRCR